MKLYIYLVDSTCNPEESEALKNEEPTLENTLEINVNTSPSFSHSEQSDLVLIENVVEFDCLLQDSLKICLENSLPHHQKLFERYSDKLRTKRLGLDPSVAIHSAKVLIDCWTTLSLKNFDEIICSQSNTRFKKELIQLLIRRLLLGLDLEGECIIPILFEESSLQKLTAISNLQSAIRLSSEPSSWRESSRLQPSKMKLVDVLRSTTSNIPEETIRQLLLANMKGIRMPKFDGKISCQKVISILLSSNEYFLEQEVLFYKKPEIEENEEFYVDVEEVARVLEIPPLKNTLDGAPICRDVASMLLDSYKATQKDVNLFELLNLGDLLYNTQGYCSSNEALLEISIRICTLLELFLISFGFQNYFRAKSHQEKVADIHKEIRKNFSTNIQKIGLRISEIERFEGYLPIKAPDMLHIFPEIKVDLELSTIALINRVRHFNDSSDLWLILEKKRLKGRYYFKLSRTDALEVRHYLEINKLADSQFLMETMRITSDEMIFSFNQTSASHLSRDLPLILKISSHFLHSNFELNKIVCEIIYRRQNSAICYYLLSKLLLLPNFRPPLSPLIAGTSSAATYLSRVCANLLC